MSYGIEYLPPSVILPTFNPEDFPLATPTADSNELRLIRQQTSQNQSVVDECTSLIEQLGDVVGYQILPIGTGKFATTATIGFYTVRPSVPKILLFNLNLGTDPASSTKGIRTVSITVTGQDTFYTATWQQLGQSNALAVQQKSIAIQFSFILPIEDTSTIFQTTLIVRGSATSGVVDWTLNDNTTYYPTLSPTDVYVVYL